MNGGWKKNGVNYYFCFFGPGVLRLRFVFHGNKRNTRIFNMQRDRFPEDEVCWLFRLNAKKKKNTCYSTDYKNLQWKPKKKTRRTLDISPEIAVTSVTSCPRPARSVYEGVSKSRSTIRWIANRRSRVIMMSSGENSARKNQTTNKKNNTEAARDLKATGRPKSDPGPSAPFVS